MIRIAFLIRKLELGGAERQLAAVVSGLDRNLFEPTILTFYSNETFVHELGLDDVTIINLNKSGRWDLVAFHVRLVRTLRSIRADIIHAFQGPPNLFALLTKPFVPRLSVIWGERASNMDLSQYDYSRRLVFALTRRLEGFSDLIICNSEAGRSFLLENGFGDTAIEVVPNGIDTDKFRADPKLGKAVRSECNVGEEDILVGLVARFDPKKDHETFLLAAARISERLPNVRFICVGDGTPERKLELQRFAAAIEVDDKVTWLGQRNDIVSVYNSLNLHTLSSAFGEGFSNSVGESMASGVPNVVTDTGDAGTIVGDSGRCVDTENPQALAEAWIEILSLTEKERDHLGTRARERVKTNYSLATLLRESMRLYASVAEKSANEL